MSSIFKDNKKQEEIILGNAELQRTEQEEEGNKNG